MDLSNTNRPSKKRVLLIGGTQRAVNTLRAILTRNDIEVTHCVFMKGHEEDHGPCDQLQSLASENTLTYRVRDHISEQDEVEIKAMNLDAIINIGVWRTLLKDNFLQCAKYGFLAVHGSALPEYRGFAGIYWQIINGEESIKLRSLQLGSGIDDGLIVTHKNGSVVEQKIPLNNELHICDLLKIYEEKHIQLINTLIDLVASDTLSFQAQDHELATYSCHRGPEDGEIEWSQSTQQVFNFIRAQSKPLSGAFTFYKGRKIYLWQVKPRPDYDNYTGRIIGKVVTREHDSGNAIILTKDGAIEVIEAQLSITDTNVVSRPVDIFNSIRAKCTSKIEAYLYNIENNDVV